MGNKKWLALVLADGQETRLGALAKELAKPAVPFGGQYRLIDFTLSNCRNSGIDTIGIMTQYQPMMLHAYVGKGSAWDLDRAGRGVHILPPYVREDGGHWYQGAADAVHQNREFVEQYEPEYVVVLYGDQIYKLDYAQMLDYHSICQADATAGVIQLPWTETGKYTIMEIAENGRIIGIADKLPHPHGGQAAMGVYIFSWKVLKQYLEQDAANPKSAHDFGKDVIPAMLADKRRLYTYQFHGYWKDAGTIETYWEASMDLLCEAPRLTLSDPEWPIYSPQLSLPPHYHGSGAKVRGSLIAGGAVILGEVENSVIFPGAYIGAGAKVKDSVILHQVRVEGGISIQQAIVIPGTVLSTAAVAGKEEGVIFVPGQRNAAAVNSLVQVSLAG